MRPIKFRGRTQNGNLIYGDLIHFRGHISIHENGSGIYHIDSDSIAQLVGYDKNGNEVYEGDVVIEECVDGEIREHIARLESMTQVPETAQFYFFPYPAPFTTLKEQSHEKTKIRD